jgi:hypothetical protein
MRKALFYVAYSSIIVIFLSLGTYFCKYGTQYAIGNLLGIIVVCLLALLISFMNIAPLKIVANKPMDLFPTYSNLQTPLKKKDLDEIYAERNEIIRNVLMQTRETMIKSFNETLKKVVDTLTKTFLTQLNTQNQIFNEEFKKIKLAGFGRRSMPDS